MSAPAAVWPRGHCQRFGCTGLARNCLTFLRLYERNWGNTYLRAVCVLQYLVGSAQRKIDAVAYRVGNGRSRFGRLEGQPDTLPRYQETLLRRVDALYSMVMRGAP